MIQVLENNINLCDSCTNRDNLPYCPAYEKDILYGTGIGNDNICCCNKYCPNVVEVVRCKECINHTNSGVCEGCSRYGTISTPDDAFCSYGVKRNV